jgi:hypothetical protein
MPHHKPSKKSKRRSTTHQHGRRRRTQFGVEGEKDPKIITYNVPWGVLKMIKPLIMSRTIKNEFSGSIHRSSAEFHNGHERAEHVEGECCSDEFECFAHASIVRGVGDSATFFEDIPFTYHTHPTYYYTEYGVKIAPPSGEDLGVFLRGCIEEKSCVHLVISREGIYYVIPNPCFVYQARKLMKRNRRDYNIALVGAEILGMQTHEFRDSWTTDRWLEWIRSRFVCGEILVSEYREDIKDKFEYHCECGEADLENFEREFKRIVREYFDLSSCAHKNPLTKLHKQLRESGDTRCDRVGDEWTAGNWIDVGFKSWREVEADGGLNVQYSDF